MPKKDVNEVRFVKYYSNYQNKNKIVDISTLPSCRSVLLLYSKRANDVTCIWKIWLEAKFEVPCIADGTKSRIYAGLRSPSQKI